MQFIMTVSTVKLIVTDSSVQLIIAGHRLPESFPDPPTNHRRCRLPGDHFLPRPKTRRES
jgi:hypothetical protein